MLHRHHIIPRPSGGKDDDGNTVRVTTSEHALLHWHRFVELGNRRDEIAYLALLKQIGKEEAALMASVVAWTGKKHTPETRAKMSAGGKGKVLTPEHRAKIGRKGNLNPFFGKHHSPETKARLSERAKSVEIHPRLGKKHSEESKALMSRRKLGKKNGPRSAETRLKISLANKGKKRNAEMRARMSAARYALLAKRKIV